MRVNMMVFMVCCMSLFFFKQKTAYEMRISDWSSDVCSSDLQEVLVGTGHLGGQVAVDQLAPAEMVDQPVGGGELHPKVPFGVGAGRRARNADGGGAQKIGRAHL